MFPRGAINFPSLFASTCILFDSVTVLKPFDVDVTRWRASEENENAVWTYERHANPNAIAFWSMADDLVAEGVVQPYEIPNAAAVLERRGAPDAGLRSDFVDGSSGGGWYTSLHALGFSSFFEYLAKTRATVVLSKEELASTLITARARVNAPSEATVLSSVAARLLAECIPTLGIAAQSPREFVRKICDIRSRTRSDRLHFKAFIFLLAGSLTAPLTPNERAEQVEQLIRDYTSVWSTYRTKLAEVARELDTPLRFASIIRDVVTLDFLGASEEIIGFGSKSVVSVQEQRSLAFTKSVSELNDYWLRK
jgi:hypothetical protein